MRRCCFWALVPALAACATFDVTPFLKEQITGDTWRACLAREYQAQARFQLRHGRKWDEATQLAQKGRRALDGADVAPDDAPAALSGQAEALRLALQHQGRTCDCATAQAKLDGWGRALDRYPSGDFAVAFDQALGACNAAR